MAGRGERGQAAVGDLWLTRTQQSNFKEEYEKKLKEAVQPPKPAPKLAAGYGAYGPTGGTSSGNSSGNTARNAMGNAARNSANNNGSNYRSNGNRGVSGNAGGSSSYGTNIAPPVPSAAAIKAKKEQRDKDIQAISRRRWGFGPTGSSANCCWGSWSCGKGARPQPSSDSGV